MPLRPIPWAVPQHRRPATAGLTRKRKCRETLAATARPPATGIVRAARYGNTARPVRRPYASDHVRGSAAHRNAPPDGWFLPPAGVQSSTTASVSQPGSPHAIPHRGSAPAQGTGARAALNHRSVVADEAAAAAAATGALGIVLLCLAWAGRRPLDRRRLTEWEADGPLSAPSGPSVSGREASQVPHGLRECGLTAHWTVAAVSSHSGGAIQGWCCLPGISTPGSHLRCVTGQRRHAARREW